MIRRPCFGRLACEERVAKPTPSRAFTLNPRSIMKKFTLKKKMIAGAAAAALVLGAGGAAIAYWTTGGSGSGSGSTGTTVDVTVNQTSASSGLYPGGSV